MPRGHSAIVYTDDPKDWAEYLRKPTQQELNELFQGITQAEQNGLFDNMFAGQCRQTAELPTKELLLDSISHDMILRKSFFLKVYGYEITWPGYSEKAIKALEDAGCSKAREYYEQITTEYEDEYQEKLKDAAEWYQKKLNDEWERKERDYNRKEGNKLRKQQVLSNLTENELTELCKRLLQEGIITSPEQFVTVLEELDQ